MVPRAGISKPVPSSNTAMSGNAEAEPGRASSRPSLARFAWARAIWCAASGTNVVRNPVLDPALSRRWEFLR
jgi:hypothetical protein